MTETKPSGTKLVRTFFDMRLPEMKEEWLGKGEGGTLTALDKEQITAGLADETYDYTPTAEQVTAAKARHVVVPGGADFAA